LGDFKTDFFDKDLTRVTASKNCQNYELLDTKTINDDISTKGFIKEIKIVNKTQGVMELF